VAPVLNNVPQAYGGRGYMAVNKRNLDSKLASKSVRFTLGKKPRYPFYE